MTHRGTDNFGFAFEEKPPPRMLPERLAALGVPAGPERRRLLAGEEIVLADGRRIAPDEVLAPPQPGTRLIVVGDAADADELLEEVRGADALIIEATFLERDADKAAERSHLTAAQAARLARAGERPRPVPDPSVQPLHAGRDRGRSAGDLSRRRGGAGFRSGRGEGGSLKGTGGTFPLPRRLSSRASTSPVPVAPRRSDRDGPARSGERRPTGGRGTASLSASADGRGSPPRSPPRPSPARRSARGVPPRSPAG